MIDMIKCYYKNRFSLRLTWEQNKDSIKDYLVEKTWQEAYKWADKADSARGL